MESYSALSSSSDIVLILHEKNDRKIIKIAEILTIQYNKSRRLRQHSFRKSFLRVAYLIFIV